jgi:hypothetical protein
MVKNALRLIVGALLIAAAPNVWAYDILNARPLALGGASRAHCPSNGSLYLNPAGMAVGRAYHVETLYGYVPTLNAQIAGGSVIDSVTSPVAMGLSFNYVATDPDGIDRNEYDVRLSAAYYISNFLALGVSLKYMYSDQEGRAPLSSSGNLFRANGDVGATLTLGEHFRLGVVGYNLTNTESLSAPLSLGYGLGVSFSSLLIVADALMDFTTRDDLTWSVMGGVEYLLGSSWPIRIGYRWDQVRETHSVSGGFGYVSSRFGIELSLLQDVSGERLHTNLVLALRYFANQ